MTDEREVLSALIDRETVDADVLARVLEDPANRAMLVDFVRLRARMDDAGELTQAPALAVPQAPIPPARRPTALGLPRRSDRDTGTTGASRPWLRVAAVFLLLAVGGGGGAWLQQVMSRERPPQPDRVVQLEPVEPR
jgi:hypothetical protein